MTNRREGESGNQNAQVGGTSRSEEDNGFIFDYAGHIICTKDPCAADLTLWLLGDNIHRQNREAWVYCYRTYTLYPFQANTYGLPVEVAKECILRRGPRGTRGPCRAAGARPARRAAAHRPHRAASRPGGPGD